MADPEGRRDFKKTNACDPNGNRQLETNGQKTSPILNTPPNFHIANIQNILTKTMDGKKCKYVKENEKIEFLKEQCEEEKPYFMVFAETCLKKEIKEVEFDIKD